ncbi:hypothetical protein A5888_002743 [Enterococcus sp. 9E7_DIV0242]|uniref:Uncharacterized protein n=1 Tax=Candidatus Enterococcus clewellii TaxID=1834193 RepID=A0A242K862_9ENTE|nr:hypothetical protein A5888_001503 [Enterococcus sp. 9E7_DIV0242]
MHFLYSNTKTEKKQTTSIELNANLFQIIIDVIYFIINPPIWLL